MPGKKKRKSDSLSVRKAILNQRAKSMRSQNKTSVKVNSPNRADLNIINEDESVRNFERKKALNRPGKLNRYAARGTSESYKKGGQLSQYE